MTVGKMFSWLEGRQESARAGEEESIAGAVEEVTIRMSLGRSLCLVEGGHVNRERKLFRQSHPKAWDTNRCPSSYRRGGAAWKLRGLVQEHCG
jgi:hypothetical protein